MPTPPDHDKLSHLKLQHHLQNIGELVEQSNSHGIAAINRGIRSFFVTAVSLGTLLFAGSEIREYYTDARNKGRLYTAQMQVSVNEDALMAKGGFAVNFSRLMEVINHIFSRLGNAHVQGVIKQAGKHYFKNPKSALKWGGGVLLLSLLSGMFSFIRTKKNLERQTNRAVGENLRAALEELNSKPHLHESANYNDMIKQWSEKINAHDTRKGLAGKIISELIPM